MPMRMLLHLLIALTPVGRESRVINKKNICVMLTESSTATARGLLASVVSNVLFAVLFLYSGWMRPLSGTDVFAWRMVSMLLGLCALLSFMGKWGHAWAFIGSIGGNWKKWLLIMLPTPILGSQLWLFMWAPVNGEGIHAAVGYFLFPLVMMATGGLLFRERLNAWQWLAVALAVAGVACEVWRTGAFSWTTVWVFATYPVYYLMRRWQGVPALIGLTLDLLLIAPCALVYIVWHSNSLAVIAQNPHLMGFIALLGIQSALAMQLNLLASLMLPVTMFGMLSYLEPILLFVVSIVLLHEPVQAQALPGYALIWAGLCLMIWDGVCTMRAVQRINIHNQLLRERKLDST